MFDLSKVEANKNICISQTFAAAAGDFSQRFYIPFQPDYMVVRGLNVSTTLAQDTYRVTFNGDVIASFSVDNVTAITNFTHPIFVKINGPLSDVHFQILNSAGAIVTIAGALALHLDFVKFKVEKHQHIF